VSNIQRVPRGISVRKRWKRKLELKLIRDQYEKFYHSSCHSLNIAVQPPTLTDLPEGDLGISNLPMPAMH
jgi:hypothetical protein